MFAVLLLVAGAAPQDVLAPPQSVLEFRTDTGDVVTISVRKKVGVASAAADPYQSAYDRASAEGRDLVVWVGGADCPPCEAATPNAVHCHVAAPWHGVDHGVVVGRRSRRGDFDRYNLTTDFSLSAIQTALRGAPAACGCVNCPTGTCSVAGQCGVGGCGQQAFGQPFAAFGGPFGFQGTMQGGCASGNCGGGPMMGGSGGGCAGGACGMSGGCAGGGRRR